MVKYGYLEAIHNGQLGLNSNEKSISIPTLLNLKDSKDVDFISCCYEFTLIKRGNQILSCG